MFQSEILKEKDRVQAKLSRENDSIHEYLAKSHAAAEEIANYYGFKLNYIEASGKVQHRMQTLHRPEIG
jgi:heptaprenylglyceryl phosphate synthase